MMTMLGLTALAAILACPIPALLARATWPQRAPAAGLVLWQAVGLASGLAGIGAGLALAVLPLHSHLLPGLERLASQTLAGQPLAGLRVLNVAGLAWALLLTARLVGGLVTATIRTLRSRARMRRLVDLVARPYPPARHARVLDHPAAMAYCLPGLLRPRVVLSAGTLHLLDDQQVAAVLAHEHAHTRARHDLVVLPFRALYSTLPWVPWVARAHQAVTMLVEMLADDSACRRHQRRVLATALVEVATSTTPAVPAGALSAAQGPLVARVRRLVDPPAPVPPWLPVVAYLTALILIALPTLLLAAPVVTSS
jgi:Zn-dependent protease with chaperone function